MDWHGLRPGFADLICLGIKSALKVYWDLFGNGEQKPVEDRPARVFWCN